MTNAEREAQWQRIETMLREFERRCGIRSGVDETEWTRFLADHPELDAEGGRDG